MKPNKVYVLQEVEEEISEMPEEQQEQIIYPECSICGTEYAYMLTKADANKLRRYDYKGRAMGYIQDIFPKVPGWVRSGAIDKYSNGFCICQNCMP